MSVAKFAATSYTKDNKYSDSRFFTPTHSRRCIIHSWRLWLTVKLRLLSNLTHLLTYCLRLQSNVEWKRCFTPGVYSIEVATILRPFNVPCNFRVICVSFQNARVVCAFPHDMALLISYRSKRHWLNRWRHSSGPAADRRQRLIGWGVWLRSSGRVWALCEALYCCQWGLLAHRPPVSNPLHSLSCAYSHKP